MPHIEPVPSLSDFAPLCEAIRGRALAALVTGAACGELDYYRGAGGERWYVWVEARRERLTLARWAIGWATHRAIAGAS